MGPVFVAGLGILVIIVVAVTEYAGIQTVAGATSLAYMAEAVKTAVAVDGKNKR